jgi:ribosomal protein S17E
MDFNQRKRILEDNINDNAKRMKDSIAGFPESSTKSEWLMYIENGRKENLRRLHELPG